jgi:hypothetical protein
VAISSKYGDIPRLVYGTLKGALGWERWIEGKVHLHQGGEWAGTRDMKCFSDVSFRILEEKASKGSHAKDWGESGAVFLSSGAIKYAVIWEAEVNVASDAVDTILYAGNVGRYLRYPVGEIGKVMVDNEEHVETRLFRMKCVFA